MDEKTQVRNLELKRRRSLPSTAEEEMTRPIELKTREKGWLICFLQADRLVRNLAVMGVLLVVLIAVKNSTAPEAQSVFSVLQESAGLEWDESVGKLSFVNQLLPEAIREVWNEQPAVNVYAPVSGETLHAWSPGEPYVLMQSGSGIVRSAADGEVMSIAHGMEEERILRIRHEDGTEALYGNLQTCYAQVGQRIRGGEVIAGLLEGAPLAFELRVNGRSIDPQGRLMPFPE